MPLCVVGVTDTLSSVNNMAFLLKAQENMAEAGNLFQRALDGRETTLGLTHPATLSSVTNMGMLLKDQGKLAEAESLLRRAMEGSEATLGATHPGQACPCSLPFDPLLALACCAVACCIMTL